MKEAHKNSKEALRDVACILFDGRKDDTKVLTKGEDGRYHQRVIKGKYYSLCNEPGGQYISPLTVDSKEREKDRLLLRNWHWLKYIVQFDEGVYVPMCFRIKVKKNWVEGPKHILKQLSQVRALDEEVLKIVMPQVKSTAWNAHSEQILQTMLASEDREKREFIVKQISTIR